MKKISKSFNFLFSMLISVIAFFVGGSDVMMAANGDLEGGGTSSAGNGNLGTTADANGGAQPSAPIAQDPSGIMTETGGRDTADPDFYLNDVDKKIVKIRPMSTPVDQISRYAQSSKTESFVCKYYSVGTRPIVTSLSSNVTAMTSSQNAIALPVVDPSLFTKDDTIRVVGHKAYNCKREGANAVPYTDRATDEATPDLVLVVTGVNDNGQIMVYAMNGKCPAQAGSSDEDLTKQPILVPALTAANVTLIRMGKAAGELDAQTGRFETTPSAETQYCQNFMIQVEQSLLDKIAKKEVDWGFSDLEEDAIYDMRLTQEESFLFGDLGYIKHISKSNMAQWFTKGIWWMAGKYKEIGTYSSTSNTTTISEDDLIDLAKFIFTGAGTGNKKKVVLCGSEMLAAFSKIKSDKFKLVSTFEKWNLRFTSWETGFGTLHLIHHELFDMNEMGTYGFILDPEFLRKRKHTDWTRSLLDLKKAGIRNTEAAVLQEISCLYLRYPNAHCRLKLRDHA